MRVRERATRIQIRTNPPTPTKVAQPI